MNPKTGPALDLAVAQVLGETEPPKLDHIYWQREDDGTFIGMSVWPSSSSPDFSTEPLVWPPLRHKNTDLALEAWRQAAQGTQDRLDISVWGGGDVCVSILGVEVWSGKSEEWAVATAICRALVAWREGE
jgi:hypothetical protein